MTPTVGFFTYLTATVGALGVVVWTGITARRRAHLCAVVLTLTCLGAAIFFALEVGKLYDLSKAGIITPIHLVLAKVATVALLLPAVTGVLTWRDTKWKRLHARLAYTVIALIVVTTITGALMLMGAELIE